MSSLISLLYRHRQLLSRCLERSETVLPAAIALLAGGMVSLPNVVVAVSGTAGVSGGARPYFLLGSVLSVVVSAALVSLLCLLFAGSFHTLSVSLYDLNGRFSELFRLTALGFAGVLLSGVISSLVAVISVVAGGTPPTGGLIRLILTVANYGCLCWSLVLWIAAVQTATGASVREALVIVSLPTVFVVMVLVLPRVL